MANTQSPQNQPQQKGQKSSGNPQNENQRPGGEPQYGMKGQGQDNQGKKPMNRPQGDQDDDEERANSSQKRN